jgi:hypothetical protein
MVWFGEESMVCIACRQSNPDENAYCGRCGAELGHGTAETILKRELRDRKAIEYELTENVADRLKKWVLFGAAILAVTLGYGTYDLKTAESSAKDEINRSTQDAKKEIDAARGSAVALGPQIASIEQDVQKYRETNAKIDKLQKDLGKVSQEVVDFGAHTLKAKSIETSFDGPGFSGIEFGKLGCPKTITDQGMRVDYCTQGSPETLYQLTAAGELKPVASRSPVGFQDASTAAKPSCDAATRGTFYVEKGGTGKSDEPFLCEKKANDHYGWLSLSLPSTDPTK